MAATACWRCQRTDTIRITVVIQTRQMPKLGEREQCKDSLACITESMAAEQKRRAKDESGVGR